MLIKAVECNVFRGQKSDSARFRNCQNKKNFKIPEKFDHTCIGNYIYRQL